MEIGISYWDVGKYIRIYEETIPGRKTPIYYLCSQDNELIKLGEIKWFSRWRKYCYFPYDETVFDSKCLMDIVSFMDSLNNRRK